MLGLEGLGCDGVSRRRQVSSGGFGGFLFRVLKVRFKSKGQLYIGLDRHLILGQVLLLLARLTS